MSKLLRSATLAATLLAFIHCGGTSPEVTEGAGGSTAQGGSAAQGGSDTAKAGSSSSAGNTAQAGAPAGGASGGSHVGGAAGTGGGNAEAGTGGAAGVRCGDATCGPNSYCRAPCSGTGFGVAGSAAIPAPQPSCSPLPPACNGTPTCDCICGGGSAFWCSTGSKPLAPSSPVQCGCA